MPASPSQHPVPIALAKEGDDRLVIQWSDGHRGVYRWKHLRDHCPCAGCREEAARPPDPFRILTDKELSAPRVVRPVELTPVGRYAYKIVWNDGHDTGLYTLENLRALCECDACSAQARGEDHAASVSGRPEDQSAGR